MSRDTKVRFYDSNHLESATITAPDGGSFPLSNALNVASRATFYRLPAKTATIEVDAGYDMTATLFSIMGRANTPMVFSEEAVIMVKANNINIFDGSEPLAVQAEVTDVGVFAYLDTKSSPDGQSYRYWRIEIDDSNNPDDLDINYMFLGEAFTFNHNINKGFSVNIVDQTLTAYADSGNIYVNPRPQFRRLDSLGIDFLDYATSKELLKFVSDHGTFKPFLLSIDPTEQCFDHEFGHYIVYFERIPVLTHIKTNYFNVNFSLVEKV